MWYACCLLIKYCFLMFTHFSSFLLCQLHKLYIEINIYQVVKHLMPFFWKSVRSYTVADLAIFELKIICICPWNGQFSKACRFWPICLWICQFLLVKKNLIGHNFWSTRHRDFIFGMNNMTPFQWKGQWIHLWPFFTLILKIYWTL